MAGIFMIIGIFSAIIALIIFFLYILLAQSIGNIKRRYRKNFISDEEYDVLIQKSNKRKNKLKKAMLWAGIILIVIWILVIISALFGGNAIPPIEENNNG